MTTTNYSGQEFNACRKKIQKYLDVPLNLDDAGWSTSPLDVEKALKATPNLFLKDGYRLIGFVYRDGFGNGHGLIRAFHENNLPQTLALAKDEELSLTLQDALDLKEVLLGDRSMNSYVQASLLCREFEEYGAAWHGCSWSTHNLLVVDPWQPKRVRVDGRGIAKPSEWEWCRTEPQNWSPAILIQHRTHVRFYSYSGMGEEKIVEHLDSFKEGTWVPKVHSKTLATGNRGYIF